MDPLNRVVRWARRRAYRYMYESGSGVKLLTWRHVLDWGLGSLPMLPLNLRPADAPLTALIIDDLSEPREIRVPIRELAEPSRELAVRGGAAALSDADPPAIICWYISTARELALNAALDAILPEALQTEESTDTSVGRGATCSILPDSLCTSPALATVPSEEGAALEEPPRNVAGIDDSPTCGNDRL